jgi:group II intron reverse transcriptase/maturase
MYENITHETTLIRAFVAVRRNKGCPGIDHESIAQFREHLGTHIRELARLLQEKRYEPLPAKRVYIPKPNGKQRPLGIPAVRDRIVQQAVRETIEPRLERTFNEASYGFRSGRNAHQAIEKIRQYITEGYEYVVDADIRDFFGTLNHQILMEKVRRAIPDRDITSLIWQFLRAGVMEEGTLKATTTGTPQGGVISPVLANLYLTEFDECMERAGLKLVRYADDFVILCKSVNQAAYAMRTAREKLGKLKLTLAEEKTRIAEASQGFTFLGHTFWKCKDTLYTFPSDKALCAFKEKVRHVTRRQQPRNIMMVIEKLNPIVRGWGNYFSRGHSKTRFQRLDEWTRMRLRSFLFKQRRVSLKAHTKYPNAFFRELGLVFLLDLMAPKP